MVKIVQILMQHIYFHYHCFFFLFYRVVSAVMVFRGTRNVWYAFGQFLFEYMLYRAVWVNYIRKCKRPCSPQKWLQNMEAFPQLIIQMFFTIKSGEFEGFVVFSIVWSMISMVNKAASEDRQLFAKYGWENWQDAQWTHQQFPFVNVRYLIRLLFRIFDISHRALIIVLVWTELGGLCTVIAATVEFTLLFAIVTKTKELSILFLYFISYTVCLFFFSFFAPAGTVQHH